MVALSSVLVPLMVTGAYGVVVSLMFVKAHLGMTTCTPQLPVQHHHSSADTQSACNMQGGDHCNQGQHLANLQLLQPYLAVPCDTACHAMRNNKYGMVVAAHSFGSVQQHRQTYRQQLELPQNP